MTEHGKRRAAMDRAAIAVRNWGACPLSELRDACKWIDGAVLLLIRRLAG